MSWCQVGEIASQTIHLLAVSQHSCSDTQVKLCLRLDLDGLPGLVLDKPSFPLSFAQWKGATADDFWRASQWEGSSSGMFLQSSPLYGDMDVRGSAALSRQAAQHTTGLRKLCASAASCHGKGRGCSLQTARDRP